MRLNLSYTRRWIKCRSPEYLLVLYRFQCSYLSTCYLEDQIQAGNLQWTHFFFFISRWQKKHTEKLLFIRQIVGSLPFGGQFYNLWQKKWKHRKNANVFCFLASDYRACQIIVIIAAARLICTKIKSHQNCTLFS